MEVIYGLLPGMLLLGVVGVAVFFWAVKSGQYEDIDGAASRVLMDDDDEASPATEVTSNAELSEQSDHPVDQSNSLPR